jgi:hypothetical protein
MRPSRRHLGTYAVPAALVVGWLAIALTHLRLPYPSDQLHYLEAAPSFPRPIEGSTITHQMTRFGLIGPTRLAMMIFGHSEATYYFVPLLSGVLLLLATYAIGAVMFSRVVGAAAAIILLTYTPIFFDTTELLPDLFATGLFTVAVALAVAVRRGLLPARPWALLLIGFLLGWSYLVREFIVFVWPLVPVVLWPRLREDRPLWRGLVWLALPIVVLGAAETLLCWIIYDDPLARIRSITGHGEGPTPDAIAQSFQNKPRHVYLVRLWAVLNGTGATHYPEQWVMRPLLLAMVAGALLRPRRLGVFALWTALLWAPLTLLGGLLDPSAPKLRLQLIRYWFPVFPAIVLGGVATLWLVLRYLGRRLDDHAGAKERPRPAAITRVTAAVPAVAVACVTAASVFLAVGNWATDPDVTRGARDMAAFRSWMHTSGDGVRTVWSDSRTRHVLMVFQHGPFGGQAWPAQVRWLQPGGQGIAPGDMVVLFDAAVDAGGAGAADGAICGVCRTSASQALGDPVRPPANWRQVYASSDGILRAYSVARVR